MDREVPVSFFKITASLGMKAGAATVRTLWRCLREVKVELPYDPATPHLDIYTEKTIIQNDACSPVFTPALSAAARTWKQPQYPSADERIKLWCTHAMEYYSAIKKNEIMSFSGTWMNLEIVILSEVSQKEISYHILLLFFSH